MSKQNKYSNPKKDNDLAHFLIGLAMLVVGGYLFSANVIVYTGFHVWIVGSYPIHTGAIVVPFIVGIIMLFVCKNKFFGKVVTGLGLLLIVASIILGTRFHFKSTSLYVYLLMLIGLFGGLALVLKALFGGFRSSK